MKKNFILLMLLGIMTSACSHLRQSRDEIITKESREEPDFSKGILTEEILWHFGRVSAPQCSPDGQTLLYMVKYYDYKLNKGNADIYTIPVAGGTPHKITSSANDEMQPVWRPDGQKIAYLLENSGNLQIWECNPNGSEKRQVTDVDGGVTGFAYAPDMKHLLYVKNVKLDTTAIDLYPDLPKANAYIYDDLMYRHWNTWADGAYSHPFIAEYPSMKYKVELLKDEKFHTPVPSGGGMEQFVWSPNGKKLAYCCKRKSGKDFAESTNSDIFIYDLESQKTENITPNNKGYDMDPVFSPDGSKLVWWSMKTDGYESDKQRLFIYDFTTAITIDYSEHFDHNASHFVWNAQGDKIYFLSCIEATYQVYCLDLNSKIIKQITSGDHDYTSLQITDTLLVVTKTTHALPVEIFTINLNNGKEQQLTFTNQEILDKIVMGKTEKRWISTTDGQKMLTWIIYPPNFDPTKKYPALLYCQGGPQQAVSQFFSFRWCFQMMAAHDYIIVAPNRHGLPGFGSRWNEQISKDYGGQNMQDYLSAIDAVAKEPYIDKERLGAVGASYGGFSVYWLAGHHQKRFKAFIAHCGMFNFESWYGTTEELFFANHDIEGPYWKTPIPKSYSFSPHKFAGRWDTPILVIHGGNDFRIPYTEGMQAFNAAQIQGIPSRFLFFPDEDHFVSQPQNAILWQREFFRWLDTYLK
ncbi:MAG: S9 family peptidase [Bacteroidales bacterium]|jgi:dipeptidyl aminopeptidase/acylaminoacyl peptidase|nr:S9 family peptidase [Bacteroidales bacterium]